MEGDNFLGCGVESAEFGFGGRRHDKLHYLGDGENQTIAWGRGYFWRQRCGHQLNCSPLIHCESQRQHERIESCR